MKDFFTWDEMTRDLLIVVVIGLIMYISANITPVTIDTVLSGTAFSDLLDFLQGKTVSLSTVQMSLIGLQSFLAVLAVLFFAGLVGITLRMREVHTQVYEQYKPIPVEETEAAGDKIAWHIVRDHMDSENPAEWKLAILEADNMLDEVLEDQGYFGETVADKLKAMSPSRVTVYNELWEAHKLRNEIAHGGTTGEDLTKKAARDAIAVFERAFKELGYLRG